MPANFVKGDIFDEATQEGGVRALAFPADCGGTMDTGIASAVKKRWPKLADELAAHGATNKMQLGDVYAWRDGDLFIYALGIQKGGAKPKVSSVERALQSAAKRAVDDGVVRILLPRIGGGKSGLDWARVKHVIVETGAATHIDLVVFEQFVRKAPEA